MHTLFCLIVTTTCSEIPGDNTSNIWNPDMKKTITIPAPINKTARIAGDMVNPLCSLSGRAIARSVLLSDND